MTTEHPDLELARRARSGDSGAWQEIYRSTRERLFGLLAYQTGNRDEALDILQDTYLVAIRAIGRYKGSGSLENWLVGIALNRAGDWKRRLLPRFKHSKPLDSSHEESLSISPAPHEERRRLQRALDRLPARQRSAVLLYEWFGYSFREVARILVVSEATARVHCFRARESLRILLDENEPASHPGFLKEQKP
jgi:RNA polymerase sigma factor (sigma-70 family)